MYQRQPHPPNPGPPPQGWQVDPDRLRWVPVFDQTPEPPAVPQRAPTPPSFEQTRSGSHRLRSLVVVVMSLAAVIIGIVFQQPIQRLMAAMESIGSGAPAGTQTAGLIAFGLILVLIVSIVRILTPKNRR